MLGHKADELAALVGEGKDAEVAAILKAAQWREWELRVRVKPHEYNGDRKLRCQVVNVSAGSWEGGGVGRQGMCVEMGLGGQCQC